MTKMEVCYSETKVVGVRLTYDTWVDEDAEEAAEEDVLERLL